MKAAIEGSAIRMGVCSLSRRRNAGSTIVLAYHNIVPSGAPPSGDRSLHLPQRAFAQQLDELQRTHDVVGISDLLMPARAATPGRARPRAVITFDDAYQGTVTAGVAELRQRGLPATIFVTPAFVGGRSFWWDELAGTDGELPAGVRDTALTTCSGRYDDVLDWATANGVARSAIPPHARCASKHELAEALGYTDLTFGSHTWSHCNLPALTDSEMKEEMDLPRHWLEERFGDRALPIISYPYGLADSRVHAAAESAGYTAGFMIGGGWMSERWERRLAIPRLNIPAGVSHAGFVLRAAGLVTH